MTALAVGPVALRPLKLTDAPKLRAIVDEESWQGNSTPFQRLTIRCATISGH